MATTTELCEAARAVVRDPDVIGNTEASCRRLNDLNTAVARATEPDRLLTEGYDSPEQTHRRLVRLLEYVTGILATGTDDLTVIELEHVEERLTKIIRDMPANRTREGR